MKTGLQMLAITVATVLFVGCGNSSSSEAESDSSADAAAELHAEEEAEEEEREAEQAAAEAARVEAKQARFENCSEMSRALTNKLSNIDSRLSIGMPFAAYSQAVGDARVAYDRMFKTMATDPDDLPCLMKVLVPLEGALNAYARGYNVWNDCIGDLYCTMEGETLSDVQGSWSTATTRIAKADRALANMEPAA